MKNPIKLLVYPTAIILLIMTVVSLLCISHLTIYFAIASLILFVIELIGERKDAEALYFIIGVLIIIILYKALT